MLRLDAASFHNAVDSLSNWRSRISMTESDASLGSDFTKHFKETGERLISDLDVLQAQTSGLKLQRLLDNLENPSITYKVLGKEIEELISRLNDELRYISVYVLDDSKAKYFETPDLFGSDFTAKFPSAIFEVDEAGKCYAVHRHTAAVFHLMRVMELGIRAAGKCLGIPDPVKDADRNWGKMLRNLKDELDRRGKTSPLWNKAERTFFEDVYVSLDAVRNAWRNATMHVEKKYSDEEAAHVLTVVRAFMMKLASRMNEQGLPLA